MILYAAISPTRGRVVAARRWIKYYMQVSENNLTELGLWFYTESVKGLIYTDQVIMERTLPVLPVDDLRVAKDFYATKLGFL
jgi:hypothetical protein